LSDVTSNKSSNLDGGLITGSTAAATVGSGAALRIAGGANSETQIADLCVWNSALTDANILTLANGRVAKLTAQIDGSGTLELAGPDPAIPGIGLANIVNISSAAVGLLVSGPNELVGGIDGIGNVTVNAGASLTASHIVENALVIGGTATSPATVTIAASDAQGHPSFLTTTVSQSPSVATTNAASPLTSVGSAGAAFAETAGRTPALVPGSSSTRPVSTEGPGVPSEAATVEIPRDQAIDDQAIVTPNFVSSGRPRDTSDRNGPAASRTLVSTFEPTSFIENADALVPSSLLPPLALDSVLGATDSWLATIDPTLDLLVDAWRRSQII
jgi:hypothetical protein